MTLNFSLNFKGSPLINLYYTFYRNLSKVGRLCVISINKSSWLYSKISIWKQVYTKQEIRVPSKKKKSNRTHIKILIHTKSFQPM